MGTTELRLLTSEKDEPASSERVETKPAAPKSRRNEVDEQQALAWCRRIGDGDASAFSELVHAYQDRVFAFCARMLGDRHEAEDVAQDVFLSVFKHAGDFRGEASFNTWIYRIARNHALNRIKYLERRGRAVKRSLDEMGEERLASPRLGPDAEIEGRQTSQLVRDAIARLPEQQRSVLVLRDLEGLAYEDITDITGLALGTVKSRIHRARAALAERLSRVLS